MRCEPCESNTYLELIFKWHDIVLSQKILVKIVVKCFEICETSVIANGRCHSAVTVGYAEAAILVETWSLFLSTSQTALV